jgi:hypothetical protein
MVQLRLSGVGVDTPPALGQAVKGVTTMADFQSLKNRSDNVLLQAETESDDTSKSLQSLSRVVRDLIDGADQETRDLGYAITALQEAIRELNSRCAGIEARICTLGSSPALDEGIRELNSRCEGIEAKIGTLGSPP